MIRSFLKDVRANYALVTAIALLPIMGALALALDYSEMTRQRQAMSNALDAAGIATARQVVSGDTDAELIAYANDFFEANLGPVNPADTTLDVTLPDTANGGGTLSLTATLNYHPDFYPVFAAMLGKDATVGSSTVSFSANTEVRLKNTLEVALVLDNSGSMSQEGYGSGEKRIDLLKAAAKELVSTLAGQARLIKQVEKPVRFGLVPFAASVNVGPQHAGDSWMDGYGISPIHHENFNWASLDDPGKGAVKSNGIWYKAGTGWGAEEGGVLSRFSLYRDMRQVTSREWVPDENDEPTCVEWDWDGDCDEYERGHFDETVGATAGWRGCVEARPWPYNVNDAPPDAGVGDGGAVYGDPATLFVPMFAPDEPGDVWKTEDDSDPDYYDTANNWWNDGTEDTAASRLTDMKKYFEVRPYGVNYPRGTGPDYSCTTKPITPLVDVTTEDGLTTINNAIDAMTPNGGTNVPEGLAWGWRVVSSGVPFTQGRPDGEKGNDKVVIVLTDGANTYYTPASLGYADPAGTQSIYSSYGYLDPAHDDTEARRLFQGTDSAVGQYDYTNGNYTRALNQQMQALCTNAKAAGMMVMTVSLDLDSEDADEAAAIAALKACASESRFRSDPADPSKPAKLYWNATGADLSDTFEDIADELSNLRIVG